MTAEQKRRPRSAATRGHWKAAVWIAVAVVLLVLIAVNARMGAVSPRIRNPEVDGAPRPVEPLFGYEHWFGLFQIFTIISMSMVIAAYVFAWRRYRCAPGAADGHRPHADRLAGPDHELVAVRRLQPATVALARGLAPGVAVADGRTVPGHRVHHVLPRPVLPGDLDPAEAAGPQACRLVRVAAPADQPGADHPADRVRHRHDARGHPGPHRLLHLLAGHPVGFDLRREAVPVPADLGIR